MTGLLERIGLPRVCLAMVAGACMWAIFISAFLIACSVPKATLPIGSVEFQRCMAIV